MPDYVQDRERQEGGQRNVVHVGAYEGDSASQVGQYEENGDSGDAGPVPFPAFLHAEVAPVIRAGEPCEERQESARNVKAISSHPGAGRLVRPDPRHFGQGDRGFVRSRGGGRGAGAVDSLKVHAQAKLADGN